MADYVSENQSNYFAYVVLIERYSLSNGIPKRV